MATRKGRTFPSPRDRIRNEGDCPRMNRRNDRAIIPSQGTRNFRNKEADGAAAWRSKPATKLAYEVHLYVYGMYVLVNVPRENSVALNPSNETFNNFPRRNERRRAYLRYYAANIQRRNSTCVRGEESEKSIAVSTREWPFAICAIYILNM